MLTEGAEGQRLDGGAVRALVEVVGAEDADHGVGGGVLDGGVERARAEGRAAVDGAHRAVVAHPRVRADADVGVDHGARARVGRADVVRGRVVPRRDHARGAETEHEVRLFGADGGVAVRRRLGGDDHDHVVDRTLEVLGAGRLRADARAQRGVGVGENEVAELRGGLRTGQARLRRILIRRDVEHRRAGGDHAVGVDAVDARAGAVFEVDDDVRVRGLRRQLGAQDLEHRLDGRRARDVDRGGGEQRRAVRFRQCRATAKRNRRMCCRGGDGDRAGHQCHRSSPEHHSLLHVRDAGSNKRGGRSPASAEQRVIELCRVVHQNVGIAFRERFSADTVDAVAAHRRCGAKRRTPVLQRRSNARSTKRGRNPTTR